MQKSRHYLVLIISLKRNKTLEWAKMSLEPDLNQRPKDICLKTIYSPPLYQLSYRGLVDVRPLQMLQMYLHGHCPQTNQMWFQTVLPPHKLSLLQNHPQLQKFELPKKSLEPDLNQRPKDICKSTILQSSALPTELSRVGWWWPIGSAIWALACRHCERKSFILGCNLSV